MNRRVAIIIVLFLITKLSVGQNDSIQPERKDTIKLGSTVIQHTDANIKILPPTKLTATDGTEKNHIDVDWNKPSGGERFLVYRSDSSPLFKGMTLQNSAAGFAHTDYSDRINLKPMQLYYYRIISVDKHGLPSNPSKFDSGFIPAFAFNTVPEPLFQRNNNSEETVICSWVNVHEADKYRLQIVDNDFEKWDKSRGYTNHPNIVLDIEITDNEYLFSIPDISKKYAWSLQAIKGHEKTAFSNYQILFSQKLGEKRNTNDNLRLDNVAVIDSSSTNNLLFVPLTISNLSKNLIKNIDISFVISKDENLDSNDLQVGTYSLRALRAENTYAPTLVVDIEGIPSSGQFNLIIVNRANEIIGENVIVPFTKNE